MGFIAELFGYLLNVLYTAFNNYGIAIIVFSVILRLILIPITIKQQKSMKKSAELQDIRPPARRAGREKVRPP